MQCIISDAGGKILEKQKAGFQAMRSLLHRMCAWYVHFAEKQGFPIIITVCVGVIAATALWSDRKETSYVSPTPPVGQSISAAQLLQQSLRERSAPTPVPTESPRIWHAPLEDVIVLREYSPSMFCQGIGTGIWQLHDAVDLSCNPGDKVCSMASGRIIDCGKNDLLGVWFCVDHEDGIQALYAGMALAGPFLPGDEIKAGAVIGYAGEGPFDEQDLPPHLHLRVTQNGHAMDPVSLWNP